MRLPNKFNTLLEQLKEEYDEVVKMKEYYRKTLEEFNKDEEIQELRNQLHNSYTIPDYMMKEMKNFAHKHKDETKHSCWSYIITPTHLDDCVACKCNVCGKILKMEWI